MREAVSCLPFPNITTAYQTKTSWVFSVSYLVGRELSRRTPDRLLKKPMDQNTRESCRSILNVYLIISPSGPLKTLTAGDAMAVGTGNHCWRILILHGGDMALRGRKLVLGVGEMKNLRYYNGLWPSKGPQYVNRYNCYWQSGGVIREKNVYLERSPQWGWEGW